MNDYSYYIIMGKDKMKKELGDIESLKQCADRFGVVGDITRLRICWLLCEYPELAVGEIADVLDLNQSTVSHALKKLKSVGVVSNRKESTFKYYSLSESPIGTFIRSNISK